MNAKRLATGVYIYRGYTIELSSGQWRVWRNNPDECSRFPQKSIAMEWIDHEMIAAQTAIRKPPDISHYFDD